MRKRACKGCISKVGMVSVSQAVTLTESMCEFAKTSTYADTLLILKVFLQAAVPIAMEAHN